MYTYKIPKTRHNYLKNMHIYRCFRYERDKLTLDDSPDFFVVQCLQDELERNKIDVEIDVKRKQNNFFHHQHAHAAA